MNERNKLILGMVTRKAKIELVKNFKGDNVHLIFMMLMRVLKIAWELCTMTLRLLLSFVALPILMIANPIAQLTYVFTEYKRLSKIQPNTNNYIEDSIEHYKKTGKVRAES